MKNYQKIWVREYFLHRMSGVVEALNMPLAQRLMGLTIPSATAIGLPRSRAAFCARPGEWERFLRFLEKVFSSPKEFCSYSLRYEKSKMQFLSIAKRVGRASQIGGPNERLAELFESFQRADRIFLLIGQWWSYYLAEISDTAVQELAGKITADVKERTRIVASILSPGRMSQIRKHQKHLFEIALAPANRRSKMLDEHIRRFQWIPSINILNPPPWSRAFFNHEVEDVLRRGSASDELRSLKRKFIRSRAEFRDVRKRFSASDRRLVDQSHLMSFLKDDRDDARRLAYFSVRPLYRTIRRHLRLSEEQIMLHTDQEILDALRGTATLSPQDFAKRKEAYCIRLVHGRAIVLTGQVAKRMQSTVDFYEPGTVTQVSGITASPGKAQGRVVVIQKVSDLRKVKNRDILVAVTTHPDYLSAMRRAAGFVTDEGGLTSHAAIIAREMDVPCVVGTKIATKVLKDGDRVEVDADKGTVKKR